MHIHFAIYIKEVFIILLGNARSSTSTLIDIFNKITFRAEWVIDVLIMKLSPSIFSAHMQIY